MKFGIYERELKVALDAVRVASQICRNVQSAMGADSLEKKDKSPVTIADYASQATICKSLRDSFPGELIVGEEDAGDLRKPDNQEFRERTLEEIRRVGVKATAEQMLSWIDAGDHDGTADRYWTLDPIDGTKGFLRKEQFAISLALLIQKRIEVAVLACPNLPVSRADGQTGVLFYAVRDNGAWMVPLDDLAAVPQSVQTSAVERPARARMCESVESGHSAHDQSAQILDRLGIMSTPVRMDSQAKYGAVARGDAELYIRLPTRPGYEEKIWDHAGGVLVVEEAGGRVTDLDGQSLDFTVGKTLKNNRGVLVTNGRLHAVALAAIAATR